MSRNMFIVEVSSPLYRYTFAYPTQPTMDEVYDVLVLAALRTGNEVSGILKRMLFSSMAQNVVLPLGANHSDSGVVVRVKRIDYWGYGNVDDDGIDAEKIFP